MLSEAHLSFSLRSGKAYKHIDTHFVVQETKEDVGPVAIGTIQPLVPDPHTLERDHSSSTRASTVQAPHSFALMILSAS